MQTLPKLVRGGRWPLPLLFLIAATGAHPAQADELPPIGSPNVAIADPLIPSPLTAACSVMLFENKQFADFEPKRFSYTPPADCPGPWQKVVLSLDYSVTMGRQFDRTSTLWLGGAIVYFGTTQEPSATVAPSWHIERDLTDYGALFTEAHEGRAILGNFVGNSGGVDYTGIIQGTATLRFYPLAPSVPDHPPRPDRLLPLAGSADGGTADLVGDARLAVTFESLPTNVERAFLDVYTQSQGGGENGDEFWYFNLPDDIAPIFAAGKGTAFREAQVWIDEHPAGVAPIYPWIYTGGADPLLWRPIVGVQTLAFEPYRVDLTPFAGLLSDGRPHTVSLGVFNAHDHFSTAANLLLYLDHGSTQVTGEVTTNTLSDAPEPSVVQNITTEGDASRGTVTVSSTRQFTIAGSLQTSHGTVTTEITQTVAFSNTADLLIVGEGYPYQQNIVQTSTVDSTTRRTSGAATSEVHEQRSYPLTFNYGDGPGADGNEIFASSVDQAFRQQVDIGYVGYGQRTAKRENHLTTRAARHFDADGNTTDLQADAQQTYAYDDPFGACYRRSITASRRGLSLPGAVTAASDGEGCANGNTLAWFDVYYNYGSSVTDATIQLLP